MERRRDHDPVPGRARRQLRLAAARRGKRLKADPQFRLELEVCRKHGISHSHFKGGPATWTDHDRNAAIAYELFDRERCGTCGTFEEDWKDDEGFPLEEPVWAAVTRRCLGCEDLERTRSRIPQQVQGASVAFIPFRDLDFEIPMQESVADVE